MQVVPPSSRPQPRPPVTPVRPADGARWTTLALALAAGLAASLLAFLLLRGRATSVSTTPVAVIVTARDVPARARLAPPLLTTRRLLPSAVPEGALTVPAQAVGKITTRPLPAGTPVTNAAVTEGTAALGMAFTLPPSRRAVTVALDPTDNAADFVRPGDRVDILATDEPGSGPAEARTVLQNVSLLAVGGQTSPDGPPANETGPGHVTVSVSSVQAQALVLAAARGKIHLALRAVDDDSVTDTAPLSAALPAPEPPGPEPPARLLPTPPVPKSPPAVRLPKPMPPTRVTILVVKGSQSQTVTVAP